MEAWAQRHRRESQDNERMNRERQEGGMDMSLTQPHRRKSEDEL